MMASKDAKEASSQKVQQYKDSLIAKAEKLLLVGFPEKIVELNELLNTKLFSDRSFRDFHVDINVPVPDPILLNNHVDEPPLKKRKADLQQQAPAQQNPEGSKVMALSTGPIPLNRQLCEIIDLVKPHIRQLVEDSNELKMWVSFLIPKIEDGNNFGVSIQEDTLAEIQTVESEAAAFFDQLSRYFISRGKILSKVAKYPHLSDYRRAVQELDEKEYLSLWLMLCEIRNRYCSLHDIVTKNLEKIKTPRSQNSASLY